MPSILAIQRTINADGLLPFLEQLARYSATPYLRIDFSELSRVSPAGLAALTAFVARRSRVKLETDFVGLESCGIQGYLSRMNLLRLCGWESEEDFQRHDAAGRFVPLEEIPHDVEGLGARIAECIAPGGEDYEHPNADLYDAAWYLITEMANNVCQHSGGVGFIAAQATRSDGFVRIAIADGGQGIPGSLKECGYGWAHELPDEDIIEQALVARVSSKGQPTNEGVGLTLSSRIVELMGGHILVASLGGSVIRSHTADLRKSRFGEGNAYPGTLIALSFKGSESHGFHGKLQQAKDLDIPLRGASNPANFQP